MCPQQFHSCFVDKGLLAVGTLEMLVDWAIEPELGPSDTPLKKLAHEIMGLYKEVYYANTHGMKMETLHWGRLKST